jgi:hypothetical protein
LGQVEAFTIQGLQLWFNSSDHLPQHLHVKRRGEWEIRVFFLECTEGQLAYEHKWGRKQPSARDRAVILAAVLEHQVALLKEWEGKVCTST